jgi:hypothetical protein
MPDMPFDIESDIVYKTTSDGKELKVDIFRPKKAIKATILYAHGGGFMKGSRKDITAKRLAEQLCAEGVMVATFDYRLKADITAFPLENQRAIIKAQERSARIGMPINPHFCGPRFYAAVEDLSDAVFFLRDKDGPAASKTGPLLALGVSAGGIAALSLAFRPRGVWEELNQPDAVIGLAAAMVQPWRLAPDGLPSLLFHGHTDRIISPANTRFIARRVTTSGAPLEVIVTDTRGHNTQIDLFIDGDDPDGNPWLNKARRMMQLGIKAKNSYISSPP